MSTLKVNELDTESGTTITAPYNMRYRIKTISRTLAKYANIQAVSLGWS